jgi:O-succinylbenzoic acid--CoA ligase
MPDETLGEKVILVIESRNEIAGLNSIDWTKYFEPFEKPKEVMFSKHFDETPTGKINRQLTIKKF